MEDGSGEIVKSVVESRLKTMLKNNSEQESEVVSSAQGSSHMNPSTMEEHADEVKGDAETDGGSTAGEDGDDRGYSRYCYALDGISPPQLLRFDGNGNYAGVDTSTNPRGGSGFFRGESMRFVLGRAASVPRGKYEAYYTIDSDSDADEVGSSSEEFIFDDTQRSSPEFPQSYY